MKLYILDCLTLGLLAIFSIGCEPQPVVDTTPDTTVIEDDEVDVVVPEGTNTPSPPPTGTGTGTTTENGVDVNVNTPPSNAPATGTGENSTNPDSSR